MFGRIELEEQTDPLFGTVLCRSRSQGDDLMLPGWDQTAARHDRHRRHRGLIGAVVGAQTEGEGRGSVVVEDHRLVGEDAQAGEHLDRAKSWGQGGQGGQGLIVPVVVSSPLHEAEGSRTGCSVLGRAGRSDR